MRRVSIRHQVNGTGLRPLVLAAEPEATWAKPVAHLGRLGAAMAAVASLTITVAYTLALVGQRERQVFTV